MQVCKWGNSLAIRIPAVIVEILDLKEGDEIEIRAAGDRAIEVEKRPDLEELLARARKLRGSIPADWKFDRLEANERK